MMSENATSPSDPPVVVSNSSPLIALNLIGRIDLLRQVFGQIQVPVAVVHETSGSVSHPPWIIAQELQKPMPPRIMNASLGAGERAAIALALELNAHRLILDERPGRKLAEELGLQLIGTLGVLLVAKRRGIIPAVQPCLEQLAHAGFRVSPALRRRVLSDSNELT